MDHILFVILQISVSEGELQKYNPLKHGCAKNGVSCIYGNGQIRIFGMGGKHRLCSEYDKLNLMEIEDEEGQAH